LNLQRSSLSAFPIIHRLCTSATQDDHRRDRGRRGCDAAFIHEAKLHEAKAVTDSAGQKLAYVYFEDEPDRRSAAKLLERGEARRIAVNIEIASPPGRRHA
jgi:hypothetical protein